MDNKQETVTNLVDINLTINNHLEYQRSNAPITKQEPTVCFLQETCCKHKDTYRSKVNGWRTYHATTNQKNAVVAILISDRAGLKQGK